MKYFSTDADILRYEVMLFTDWNLNGQIVASGGGGVVSGNRFTAAAASFIAAGIEPGYVIYLTNAAGAINNRFEVISVDSPTQLTISCLRADRSDPPRTPPAATDVTYRVCTYVFQANEAFHRICSHFRITPAEAETIPDTSSLRRTSTFMTMALIFAAMATRDGFSRDLTARSELYTEAFIDALDRCWFLVTIDGRLCIRNGAELVLHRD